MARNATKTPSTKLTLVEDTEQDNSSNGPQLRSSFAKQMTEFADDLDLLIDLIERS